jgi:guanylate kinase
MDDDARPAARLTVLSGPSGVGKDSVIELIRARSPWIRLSVSVTTRKMRDYETDGEHYHFVTRPEFQRLVDGDQLLGGPSSRATSTARPGHRSRAGWPPGDRSC